MKTHDDILAEFFNRIKVGFRQASVLERLRDGSNYFSLERYTVDGQSTYHLLVSVPSDADKTLAIDSAALASVLRGPIPFIARLLNQHGDQSLVDHAQSMHAPDPEKSFLFDGLNLPYACITMQFDWADAIVPDGFKLGAKFSGEGTPTYYEIHNDVVAYAVETNQSLLELALRLCPAVVARLISKSSEFDLKAKWEALEISQAAMPKVVKGRALRI